MWKSNEVKAMEMLASGRHIGVGVALVDGIPSRRKPDPMVK